MKHILFLLTVLFTVCGSFAQDVHVNGYYRSNGTYVAPHYRTAPNSTVNDNYSTFGNVNPYTGKAGYLPRDNNNYNLPAYKAPVSQMSLLPPITYTPTYTAEAYKTPEELYILQNKTAVPSYSPAIADKEPFEEFRDDKIHFKEYNVSPDDLPSDFQPENKYYFDKNVAAPVKGALEIKSSTPPPTVKKYQSSGLEMEGVAIFVCAILGIFLFAIKLK